jgi:hypothetical protein
MTTNTLQEPQYPVVSTLQSAMESATGLAGIVSKTADDLFKIQSEALSPGLIGTVPSMVSMLTVQGWNQLLWDVPSIYQAQSRRVVGSLLDSFSALSRGQQELLEWSCQSFSNNVDQTSTAMSQWNGALASRRVSAEVIHFTDRRTSAQRASAATQESSAEEEPKANHRPQKQAAA